MADIDDEKETLSVRACTRRAKRQIRFLAAYYGISQGEIVDMAMQLLTQQYVQDLAVRNADRMVETPRNLRRAVS